MAIQLPSIPLPDAITISPSQISRVTTTSNKKNAETVKSITDYTIDYTKTTNNYNIRESINKSGETIFDLVVAPRETTKSQVNEFTQNINLNPDNTL
jgi:hypothetical protein